MFIMGAGCRNIRLATVLRGMGGKPLNTVKLISMTAVPRICTASISTPMTATSRITFNGMPICVAKLTDTGFMSVERPKLIRKLKNAEHTQ